MTLDPDLAAVLGAGLFAAVVALGGAWRRRRDLERYCVECGRRVLAGVRTCGCGH